MRTGTLVSTTVRVRSQSAVGGGLEVATMRKNLSPLEDLTSTT